MQGEYKISDMLQYKEGDFSLLNKNRKSDLDYIVNNFHINEKTNLITSIIENSKKYDWLK